MTKDRRNSVKHWENEDDEKEMERLKRSQRQRRRASEFVKNEEKNGNARRSSQFVLPLAIAIIAVIIAVYISYSKQATDQRKPQQQAQKTVKEEKIVKQEKRAQSEEQEEYNVDMNNPHVKLLMDSFFKDIARICKPLNKECYIVMDRYRQDTDGKFITHRILKAEKYPGLVLSSVTLRPILEITEFDENTRNSALWFFNKKSIDFAYIQLHLGLPFVMESLSFKPKRQQTALLIGMAGGSMSSFYGEYAKDFNLQVTVVEFDRLMAEVGEKYFGHEESDRVKVIIDDGANFAKTARSEGLLTVNILTRESSGYEEILRQFENHFASCFLLSYQQRVSIGPKEDKKLLICSHRDDYNWTKQKEKFAKNVKMVDKKLKFSLSNIIED